MDNPIRIAIVDNDSDFRQALHDWFDGVSDGAIVGEAQSGREMLEWLRQVHPDVVLLDVVAAASQGREITTLARIIVLHLPGQELRVLEVLGASTTWGIHNATPVSATVTADHTLFYNTSNHSSSGVVSTDEISGDPRFIDPAGGDYHLGAGSAAIDMGVDAGVTTDIDGDPRPIGLLPDIGADEWKPNLYLPLVLRNN